MERHPVYQDLIDVLKEELHQGVVTVVFVKESDGETREMVCTLAEKYLPEEKPRDTTKPVKMVKRIPNPDVCNVFDIQRDGWRSFRYDSIVEFRTIAGTYVPNIINKVSVSFTPSGN